MVGAAPRPAGGRTEFTIQPKQNQTALQTIRSLWQCVSMMPYAPKTGWTGDVPAKKNGQTNKIHLSIRFGGASGSRTLAPVSRPIAFRVFEIVG